MALRHPAGVLFRLRARESPIGKLYVPEETEETFQFGYQPIRSSWPIQYNGEDLIVVLRDISRSARLVVKSDLDQDVKVYM